MEPKTHYYTLPLTGHQLKGNVRSMNALLVRFMDWAERNFGISCDESISLWFNGSFDSTASCDEPPISFGLNSWAEVKEHAERGAKKLPEGANLVDITE